MNLFCKIGLSVLAGAAVLFGINCVEKRNANNSDEDISSDIINDEDVSITSSPEEKVNEEKKPGFMKSAKKTQITAEMVSKIITCLYKVFECVNDIFFINRYSRYSSYHQSTIII